MNNQPYQAPQYPPYQPGPAQCQPNPYEFQHPHPRQARDHAQYVRQQTAHSVVKAICLDWITCYMRSLYWTVSPNHYWKF